MRIAFIPLLCAISQLSSSQTFPSLKISGNNPVGADNIIYTTDNAFVLTGSDNAGAIIFKVDISGSITWQHSFPGLSFTALEKGDAGSCYVTGVSTTTSQLPFCMRFDAFGQLTWGRKIICPNYQYGIPRALAFCAADSGVIVGGEVSGRITPGFAGVAGLLVRMDNAGNMKWCRNIEVSDSTTIEAIRLRGDSTIDFTGNVLSKSVHFGDLAIDGFYSTVWKRYYANGSVLRATGLAVQDSIINLVTDLDGVPTIIRTGLQGSVTGCSSRPVPGPLKAMTARDGGIFYWSQNAQDWNNIFFRDDNLGYPFWSTQVYPFSISVCQLPDGGYAISGNGPIHGVRSSGPAGSQVVVYHVDSLGHNSCEPNSSSFSWTPAGVLTGSVPLNLVITGSATAYSPVSTTIALNITHGCVDMWGGLNTTAEVLSVVYPNPAAGHVTIRDNGGVEYWRLLNTYGEVLREGVISGRELTIDISDLPPAVYFVELSGSGGAKSRCKLIVAR